MKKYLTGSKEPVQILFDYLKKTVKEDDWFLGTEVKMMDESDKWRLQNSNAINLNQSNNSSRFESNDSLQSLFLKREI